MQPSRQYCAHYQLLSKFRQHQMHVMDRTFAQNTRADPQSSTPGPQFEHISDKVRMAASSASSRRNSTAGGSNAGGSRRGSVDSDSGFPFRLKKSKPVSQVKIVFMGKSMVRSRVVVVLVFNALMSFRKSCFPRTMLTFTMEKVSMVPLKQKIKIIGFKFSI